VADDMAGSPTPSDTPLPSIPPETLVSMYLAMLRIRIAEEQLGEKVSSGEVKCPAHLYIGACQAPALELK